MVALTHLITQESLKVLIVHFDPKFFLVKSRVQGARWKILYYTLPGGKFCKVDILIPGVLSIPFIPDSNIRISRSPHIPVIPIVALIILKLQGWIDHRDSDRVDFQTKQWVDIDDIREMLNAWARNHRGEKLHTERWMPDDFLHEGQAKVTEFIKCCPDTAAHWGAMGFEIWTEMLPILGPHERLGTHHFLQLSCLFLICMSFRLVGAF